MSRSKSHMTRLLAAAVLMALAAPFPALAKPVPWQSVKVIVHQDQSGQQTLLIAGTLPDNAKLPAEVELAAPAGSQVYWTGEILGGAPENDPSAKPQVTKRDGLDIYTFVLTTARTGQIEMSTNGIINQKASGYEVALLWTASMDVPSVRLAAAIPTGGKVTSPQEGASVQQAGDGSYYEQTFQKVKAGQKLSLAFAYTAPAQPAQPAQPVPAPQTPSLPSGTSGTGGRSDGQLATGMGLALLGVAMWIGMKGIMGQIADRKAEAWEGEELEAQDWEGEELEAEEGEEGEELESEEAADDLVPDDIAPADETAAADEPEAGEEPAAAVPATSFWSGGRFFVVLTVGVIFAMAIYFSVAATLKP